MAGKVAVHSVAPELKVTVPVAAPGSPDSASVAFVPKVTVAEVDEPFAVIDMAVGKLFIVSVKTWVAVPSTLVAWRQRVYVTPPEPRGGVPEAPPC